MFAKLDPFADAGDGDGCQVAARQLVVARRHGPVALQPIDQPLDHITLPIERPIIVVRRTLILASGDDNGNLPITQPTAQLLATIAPVTHHPVKPHPLLPRRTERDRLWALMPLSTRQRKDERFALTVGQQVQFRAPATPTAAEGLVSSPPFLRAPAAA